MSPRPGLGGQGLEACRQAGKGSFWLAYQRAQVVGLRGYDKEAIRVLGEHEFRRHAADDGLMRANDRHRGRSQPMFRIDTQDTGPAYIRMRSHARMRLHVKGPVSWVSNYKHWL